MNRKWISWKLGFTIAILALLAAGAGYWYSRTNAAITYREVPVKRGDVKVSILATGTVQPQNRLEIKPPVAGRVDRVLVEEGHLIRRGQILAWISSTERAALMDAARAKGPEEVKRWEEMYRPIPVIAPITGTLIRRNVEPGQSFANTDAILVMSDRLTVKAQVDETDIGRIRPGQTAEIILDAYAGDRLPAKTEQISFEARTINNVTTYVVDVLPDNTPAHMRAGMTANVTFFVEVKTGVLLAPTEAIRSRDGRSTVLVKRGTEKPGEIEVKLGVTDGQETEILEGVLESDILMIAIPPKSADKQGTNPFAPNMNRRRGR